MDQPQLTIGSLASAADVNVETIRYYQQLGLMPLPKRVYGTVRRYSTEQLKRLQFIKRAQRLGFSLQEIGSLLQLSDGTHCGETRTLAERKLEVVKAKLTDLGAIEAALRRLIGACKRGKSPRSCPMIDALFDDDRPGTNH